MQARSCLGSALSSPPLRGQQALPVQRPEVCSFHGGPCFWPQAVTGILFLLTASFLLDFPQFPDWPPPRYHLTLVFLFSAQIYLIYTLFSFLCMRACVCTCHRLLYSTLLQSLLWFSWLGRNLKKKNSKYLLFIFFSSCHNSPKSFFRRYEHLWLYLTLWSGNPGKKEKAKAIYFSLLSCISSLEHKLPEGRHFARFCCDSFRPWYILWHVLINLMESMHEWPYFRPWLL